MGAVPQLITWEGLAFLYALIGIVLVRLLTGSLRTRGLIAGSTAAGSQFVSAGRVQLLVVSLAAATQFLTQVWQKPGTFPEVPENWLLLFGGSQLLYLGTKFHGKRSRRFHI